MTPVAAMATMSLVEKCCAGDTQLKAVGSLKLRGSYSLSPFWWSNDFRVGRLSEADGQPHFSLQ